jgi:hypothetical protein
MTVCWLGVRWKSLNGIAARIVIIIIILQIGSLFLTMGLEVVQKCVCRPRKGKVYEGQSTSAERGERCFFINVNESKDKFKPRYM